MEIHDSIGNLPFLIELLTLCVYILATPLGLNNLGETNKTKKALVRKNENNSLSPRSSQTDSGTSKSDNSSLLVDRILNQS